MIHELKLHANYYRRVEKGTKTFEIRYNDRDYQVGDILHLMEYDGKELTGKYLERVITYITDFEQCDNYVVMALAQIDAKLKFGNWVEFDKMVNGELEVVDCPNTRGVFEGVGGCNRIERGKVLVEEDGVIRMVIVPLDNVRRVR